MTALASPAEFERAWWAARRQHDVAGLADLALSNVDSSGSAPAWFREDLNELCGTIAGELDSNLNREDDSERGVHLIQLASLLGGASCMYSLLGLAYHCIQPMEQGGEVNPQSEGLLDVQLAMFDRLPRDRWPDFALGWRELAIRRVEVLIRKDVNRRVARMRDNYTEAVRMANLILVHEPAAVYLDAILAHLPFLDGEHRRLSKYVDLLEHRDEKVYLLEDRRHIQVMIDDGRRALALPRR